MKRFSPDTEEQLVRAGLIASSIALVLGVFDRFVLKGEPFAWPWAAAVAVMVLVAGIVTAVLAGLAFRASGADRPRER